MMSSSLRRVAVVLVDRANYGRLEPVMLALRARADVELLTIVGGTMVLERFGRPLHVVQAAGFSIDAEVYQELEGSTPATMSKSVGFGVTEYANVFHRLEPDIVVIIGDRYEAFAATIAAAYMNICIVHFQGGEVSGSIDESVRHAMTKLAHYHFPSTVRSKEYLIQMGEDPQKILGVGCPSSDLARQLDLYIASEDVNRQGAGALIDIGEPFMLAVYHPITTEYGSEVERIDSFLGALEDICFPTIMLWPNIDAGSDRISKRIRIFRKRGKADRFLRVLTNLEPAIYLKILARAACAVGNSSSFVRDASFFGTPVVLVGERQACREKAEHVTAVSVERNCISEAIKRQLAQGRYPPSELYGSGDISVKAAKAIATAPLYVQKRLHYVHRLN